MYASRVMNRTGILMDNKNFLHNKNFSGQLYGGREKLFYAFESVLITCYIIFFFYFMLICFCFVNSFWVVVILLIGCLISFQISKVV